MDYPETAKGVLLGLFLGVVFVTVDTNENGANDVSNFAAQTEPEPNIPRDREGTYTFESVVMPSFPASFFPGLPNEDDFSNLDSMVKGLAYPDGSPAARDTTRLDSIPEPIAHSREKRNMGMDNMNGMPDMQGRVAMFQNPGQNVNMGAQAYAGQSSGQQISSASGQSFSSGSGAAVGSNAAAGSGGRYQNIGQYQNDASMSGQSGNMGSSGTMDNRASQGEDAGANSGLLNGNADGPADHAVQTMPLVTYYNGQMLQPGQNPYGVPTKGTFTYPGRMYTTTGSFGYPLTISSYTKFVDGSATYGAVTSGMQTQVHNGDTLPYGQNPYGVPTKGEYMIPGTETRRLNNGVLETISYYTRFIDGTPVYGTVTQSPVQMSVIINGGDMAADGFPGRAVTQQSQNQNMGGAYINQLVQQGNAGQYQSNSGGGASGVGVVQYQQNSPGKTFGQGANMSAGDFRLSQNLNAGATGQAQNSFAGNSVPSQNVNSGSSGQFQSFNMGNSLTDQGGTSVYQNQNNNGGSFQVTSAGSDNGGTQYQMNGNGNGNGNVDPIQPTPTIIPSTFQPFPGPNNIPGQGTYWYGLTTYYSSINALPVTVTSFVNYNNGAATYGAVTYGTSISPISTLYAQGSVYNVNGGLVICAECVSKGSDNSLKVVVTSSIPYPQSNGNGNYLPIVNPQTNSQPGIYIGGNAVQLSLSTTTIYETFPTVINGMNVNGKRTRYSVFYVQPNGQPAAINTQQPAPPTPVYSPTNQNPSPNSIDLSSSANSAGAGMPISPTGVQPPQNSNFNINGNLLPQGYTISPYSAQGNDKFLTYGAMSYGYPDGSNAQPTAAFDFRIVQPGNAIVGAGMLTSIKRTEPFQTAYQGIPVTGTRTIVNFFYTQADSGPQFQGGQNSAQQSQGRQNSAQLHQGGQNMQQFQNQGNADQNMQFGGAVNSQSQSLSGTQNVQSQAAGAVEQFSNNPSPQISGMAVSNQQPQQVFNVQQQQSQFGAVQNMQQGSIPQQPPPSGMQMNSQQSGRGQQLMNTVGQLTSQNAQNSQQTANFNQASNENNQNPQSTGIQPTAVQRGPSPSNQNGQSFSYSAYSVQGTEGLMSMGTVTFVAQNGHFYTATDLKTVSPISSVPGMTLTSTSRPEAFFAWIGTSRIPGDRTRVAYYYAPVHNVNGDPSISQSNDMPRAMAQSAPGGISKLTVSVQKPVAKRSADVVEHNSGHPQAHSRGQAISLPGFQHPFTSESFEQDVTLCEGNTTGICSTSVEICQWNGKEYACQCRPGFRDSKTPGAMCEDIDECIDPALSGCSADALCINLVGNFLCFCREGFFDVSPETAGSGRVCRNSSIKAFNTAAEADAESVEPVVKLTENGPCRGLYWYIGERCQIHWLALAVSLAVFALLIILAGTCLCYHCSRRRNVRSVDVSFYSGQRPVLIPPLPDINGKQRKLSKRTSTQSQNWDFPRRLMDEPEEKTRSIRRSTLTLSPSFVSRGSADSLEDRLSCGSGDQLIRTGHVRDRKRNWQAPPTGNRSSLDTGTSGDPFDVASLYPDWPKPDKRSVVDK